MENAVAELVRFLEMFREHGPLPILWVGAGASAAAGYPTLWQLEELLRKLLPGSTKTGFELIDALVEECGKALLANELETHLGKPRKFAELHRALARLAGAGLFSAIFTTNYDELIEDALKAEDIHYVPQALEHNYVLQRRKNLLVLKLHGSRTDWLDVVLSGESYASFQASYPLLCSQLDLNLRTCPLVFVGCSMTDPRLLDWLNGLPESKRNELLFSRVLITRTDWGRLSADQQALLASAKIRPILVETHADIPAVLADAARALAPLDPVELVFDLTPSADTWTIVGPTPESAPHHAPNPLSDSALLEQIAALRTLAGRPIELGTPEALAQSAAVLGLARSIGARLTDVLFSPEARAAVARRLGAVHLGRARLSLRVAATGDEAQRALADRALALPWELLMPEPDGFAVESSALDLVREAVVDGAPILSASTRPLTLAVSIAAPDGESPLKYEDEAFRLQRALEPLGHHVAFADLGDVPDLVRVAGVVKPGGLHFSGHGLPGGLVFEDDLGLARVVKVKDFVAELRLKLAPSGSGEEFPRFFFLAACHGASGETASAAGSREDGCREVADRHAHALGAALGQGASTAATLHRNGFVQVLGYFGPVSDALATRAEERFYRAVAKGASTLQAVAEARASLGEEIEIEGVRMQFPFAWTQLALYHRGPDHPLARPVAGVAPALPAKLRRKLVKAGGEDAVSGLPVLEHGFIGRRSMQHEVRRRVEKDGQRLIVLQGLGGLGKTALASHLLSHVFARDPRDALVLTCKEMDPNAEDPALALWNQAEHHGTLHGFPGWAEATKRLREENPEPAEGFERTVRLLRRERPRLVVYADNMETLQEGPATGAERALGTWLDVARPVWDALERLVDEGLVMASTRYGWKGLSHKALVPIDPMRPADVIRMIDTFEHLDELPRDVKRRLAETVDGHPRTVEYLDTLVGEQRERLGFGFNVKDAWAELVAPVLPAGAERITADLLLEVMWSRLDEAAKAAACALTVLRRPAPRAVVDALGSAEATGELIRAGVLTRFREQSIGDGVIEWVDRWGMHSIMAGFVLAQVDDAVQRDAHRAAGSAYAAWVEQPKARWSEHWEGISHFHELREGDSAWPMVQACVLWLRRGAWYQQALELLERCEPAGTTGERLATALQLLGQMRIELGDRSDNIGKMLDRAFALAESDECRGAVLAEKAKLLEEKGKYAEAETLARNAVKLIQQACGAEHLRYAVSLHGLADILRLQGKYGEAEAMLRRSLVIKGSALGVKHLEYAVLLSALAGVLEKQGDYEKAENVVRESLAIQEGELGVAHPEYAASLSVLAVVLKAQGEYGEAEALLRKSLAIREKALGMEHPSCGTLLYTLAGVLLSQGKYGEAEALLWKSLALKEKALDVEHPSLCPTLTDLGVVVAKQSRPAEAEPLLLRALGIAERIHGARHPDTAQILAYLAQLQAILRSAEAPRTAQQALDALEATLGVEHPSTRNAAPLLRQIAAGAMPGPNQPASDAGLAAQHAAGVATLEAGDARRAVDLLAPVAEQAREAKLVALEVSIASPLAQALFLTGRRDEALACTRRALEIAETLGQQDAIDHFRDLLTTMASEDASAAGNPAAAAFHASIQAALEQVRAGDSSAALAALFQIADDAQQAKAPGPEATARIVLAQVLAATYQRDQAASELRRAFVLAEQLGDKDAAAHVCALLDGLG
jgi:tetratricopeptide (TPR) repeat protein